jgi:hypothetical protein
VRRKIRPVMHQSYLLKQDPSSETSSAYDPEIIIATNEKSTALTNSAPVENSPQRIGLDDIVIPFSSETLKELHH